MSVIDLNNENFNEVVLNSEKPVLIDFLATWCVPCQMQAPVIDEVSDELEDSFVFAKVNVDENPELAAQFSVMSIPTLLFIKDGKIADRRIGLTQKETLLSMLNSVNV